MMEILYITSHINPFVPSGGSEQRYNLLLRALVRIGHVDVIAFREGIQSDIKNCDVVYSDNIPFVRVTGRINRLKRLLRPMSPYSYFPINPHRADIVRNFVEGKKYDLIVTRYVVEAYECDLMRYADRLIIDVDDSPVDEWRSLARTAKTRRAGLYYRICAMFIKQLLPSILQRVRHAYFPNKEQVMGVNVSYLPNIPFYEIPLLDRKRVNKNSLLFVGDLRYAPNYVGVEHFVDNIFPLIQKEIPTVQLYLAGKNLGPDWVKRIEEKGSVHALGFVEDLPAQYAQANVCVVPVYTGAGTNIKVLEALQVGRACVVAEEATRGFAPIFKSGEDCYVAHNDAEFAKYVITLLREEQVNKRIAEHGAKTVKDNFSKEAFYTVVKESIMKQ